MSARSYNVLFTFIYGEDKNDDGDDESKGIFRPKYSESEREKIKEQAIKSKE